MKKALCIALALVMVLGFATACNSNNSSPGGDSSAPGGDGNWNPDNIGTHSFIMAHGLPGAGMTGMQYQVFADKVAELSGGKMTVDYRPGGTLITDTQTLDSVMAGTVDFVHIKGSFIANVVTDLSPITIAGYYGGDDWLGFVDDVRPILKDIFADYGINMLGSLYEGSSVIACTTKNITSPSDVQGLTFRASGTWLSRTIGVWGGAATVIALADLADTFNRRAVDGVMTGWNIIVPFSIYEVTPYLTNTTMAEGWAGLLMNMERFNDLNADEQALITEAGLYFEEQSFTLGNQFIAEYVETSENSGFNTVVQLTPAQEQEFINLAYSLFPMIEAEEALTSKGLEFIRILKEINGIS